jgi:hypothetical protein
MQHNEEGGGLEPARKAGDDAIHVERSRCQLLRRLVWTLDIPYLEALE